MILKVPYIDKNDKFFYDIIRNESGFENIYCYELKNDLVYINNKHAFDIKMPKLIKSLYLKAPDTFFIILEIKNDTMYAFIKSDDKDFELQTYEIGESPLIQLFTSLLTSNDKEKYNIYFVENEELEKIINSVILKISNYVKIDKDDLISVQVNITEDDVKEMFTKISFQDNFKQTFEEYKTKANNFLEKYKKQKTISAPKAPVHKINYKKSPTVILGIISLPILFYFLNQEYNFLGIEEEKKEEVVVLVPQIPIEQIILSSNYNLFLYVKNLYKSDLIIDMFEYSNNEINYIASNGKTENMFISKEIFLYKEKINNVPLNLEDFKKGLIENLNITENIDFKNENQIIISIKKDKLEETLNYLLLNEKVKYNLNIYKDGNDYQVVFYTDNVINNINEKLNFKPKVELKSDTGSFQAK